MSGGFILGLVLLVVLLVLTGRFLYTKFWLERSDKYNKCKHCGKYYENNPFYCPHCGEVVSEERE